MKRKFFDTRVNLPRPVGIDPAKRVWSMGELPDTEAAMTTIAFKPSGMGDPHREEYALLKDILGARVRSGADMAELVTARIDVSVIDRLTG
ncbi:hypothetical protein QF002_005484 [Paraburkholderia youngii]